MHELTGKQIEEIEKYFTVVPTGLRPALDKTNIEWLKKKADIMKDNPTPLCLPAIQMVLGIKEESLEEKFLNRLKDIQFFIYNKGPERLGVKEIIEDLITASKDHFKEHLEELK